MTAPEEAVEAAAGKVLETLDRGFTAYQIAYAAIEAAAPFIAAQAWDEGRDAAHAEMARMYSSQCEGNDCDCNEPITNPYRSEERKTTFLRMDEPNPQWKELT